MPPLIIADSDDENDYSPPPSPQAPKSPTGIGLIRSSDRVSHATASTDPAFFQNIYNEQNDAAHGTEFGRPADAGRAEAVTSSEPTAPAPFHRTMTGFYDPSSLTSVTDPAVAKDKPSSGKESYDWTQVSTPGRKKTPAARMGDDLWEVPSSPEDTPAQRLISRIQLKKSKSKALSEASGNLASPRGQFAGHFPGASAGPHSAQATDDGSPVGRRKRRKVTHSSSPIQGSNEVDLVTIPFTNEIEDPEKLSGVVARSSMLTPTLPLSSDNSFYVAPQRVTDSQKMQRHMVPPVSTDATKGESLPAIQYQGSSGTATNINTPQNEYRLLHTPSTAPQNSEMPTATRKKLNQSPYPGRDSSPDIISAAGSARVSKEDVPRANSSVAAQNDVAEGPEGAAYGAEPCEEDLGANNVEAELGQEPIKVKKRRGRPKKKKAQCEDTKMISPATCHVDGGESTTTRQKKKRGRPRKSEQAAPVKEDTQAHFISAGEDARIAKQAAEVDGDERQKQASGPQHGDEAELGKQQGQEDHDKDQEAAPEASTGSNPNSKSKGIGTKTSYPEDSKPTPAVQREEEAATKKGSVPSVPGSASKPLFRVGLSKKSRIAPLLKSLRK